MSQDPFDVYREDLVAAARARPARWRGVPRRGIVVALVGLSVAGTATAAMVATQTGEPSAPAAGPLPAAPGLPPRSRTYTITVTPDLRAGAVGWCYGLQLRTAGRATASGTGCGPAWTAAMHLYGGGNTAVPGGVLDYAVVPPEVATVVFGGRRVAPRPERSLPYDWRIAVLPRPGQRYVPRPGRIAVLDSAGRRLPQRLDEELYARGAPIRRLAGEDLARNLSSGGPAGAPRGRARCRIAGGPRGYRVAFAAVATGGPAVPKLRDRAFFTCATTVLRRGRTRLDVAVLLDAEDPARAAGPLPVLRRWSSRRLGPGWLVVAGGSAAVRSAALRLVRARIAE